MEQWLSEVVRQPGLILTLVVAPFILLVAFGTGVELGGPRPRTVVAESADARDSLEPLIADLEQYVDFRGFEDSLLLARRSLERGDIDAVIVVPDDPAQFLERGVQVPLQVLIGEVDPVRRSYARAYLRDQVAALNQRTIEDVVSDAQGSVGNISDMTAEARQYVDLLAGARGELEEARTQVSELRTSLEPLSRAVESADSTAERVAFFVPGLSAAAGQVDRLRVAVTDLESTVERLDTRLSAASGGQGLPSEQEVDDIRAALDEIDAIAGPVFSVSPGVISAPFVLELQDVTPVEPTFTSFYSPGVVALLVQHLAITLAALTLSRVRVLRVVDMLRVAPIRASEVVLGNYIGYGLLCGVAAAGLIAMMVGFLDVPMSGSWLVLAGTVALLILCSLGVGFVVSLLSSSTQQATQVAMLILLGSIFFSGFVFSIDRVSWPARALTYTFPGTYALRSLQDEMLRGLLRSPEDLVFLGVGSVALFALAVWLMRRELRPR